MTNRCFEINENQFMVLIAEYLREKGCYEAVSSLLLETNISFVEDCPSELLFLQRLILQGRWKETLNYLKPIIDSNVNLSKKITFIILKQKLLETLSWQGAGGERLAFPPWKPTQETINNTNEEKIELNEILEQINTIKAYCSIQQFNSLCLFLSLEKLEDHPEYVTWTIAEGRLRTFSDIHILCSTIFLMNKPSTSSINEDNYTNNLKLLQFLSLGLLQCNHDNINTLLTSEHQSIRIKSLSQSLHNISSDVLDSLEISFSPMIHVMKRFPLPSNMNVSGSLLPPQTAINTTTINTNNTATSSSSTPSMYAPPSSASTPSLHTPFTRSNELNATVAWPTNQKYQEQDQHKPIPPSLNPLSSNPKPVLAPESIDKSRAPVSWTVDLEALPKEISSYPLKEESKDMKSMEDSSANNINNNNNMNNNMNGNNNLLIFDQEQSNRLPPAHLRKRLSERGPPAKEPEKPEKSEKPERVERIERVEAKEDYPRPISSSSSSANKPTEQNQPNECKPKGKSNIPLPSKPDSSSSNQPPQQQQQQQQLAQQAQPITIPRQEYRNILLYRTDCPLRCITTLNLDYESHDGYARIAIGSNSKSIHILKFRTNSLFASPSDENQPSKAVEIEHTLENVHKGSVYAMDWNKHQQILATASNDKIIRLSKPFLGEVGASLKGHNGTIRIVKYRPSDLSTEIYLASAGAGDFKPRIWDIRAGSCIRILPEHSASIHALSWINDNVLVTGCEGGQLMWHDIRAAQPIHIASLPSLVREYRQAQGSQLSDDIIRSICSIDYKHIHGKDIYAIGSISGYMSILQQSSSQQIHSQPISSQISSQFPSQSSQFIGFDRKIHSDDIRALMFLPSNQYSLRLLTSSYDKSCQIWNFPMSSSKNTWQGDCISRWEGHQDKVLSLSCFSEQSQQMLTTGADGRVYLWYPK